MKFGASQLRFEDLHYSLSARTIALLLLYNYYIYCADGYVAAKLMFRLICNLPELNIRIFQSACFLFFY